MNNHLINTLFCDIGGVLLTNGWDRHTRALAAKQYGFDIDEFDARHQLCFYLYETGMITLKEYLDQTLFYKPRDFTLEEFIDFMHNQSQPYEEMINFVKDLKKKHSLKVVLLSNEGKELTEYRQNKFKFAEFVDLFVISSYVYLRKPDKRIFQMAIDLVQRPPKSIIYLDDRQMFIDITTKMGIHAIKHTDLKNTQKAVESLFIN